MRGALGTAVLGLALVLAGGLFDGEPLLAAGAGLFVLAGLAAAWGKTALSGADLRRSLSAARVVEDQPCELRLEARSALPLAGAEVVDPLLDRAVALPAGRRRATVRLRVRFARRGLRRLRPAVLWLGDPLGIVRLRVASAGGDRVLVLPRVEAIRWPGAPAAAPAAAARARTAGPDGVSPDGLRPYREGVAATRIHWPALARGAGLLEKRLVADAERRPLVVLDAGGAVPAERLDAAVRAAASLCRELARSGGCGLLVPGERRPRQVGDAGGSWASAWARLATVQPAAPVRLPAAAAGAAWILYVTPRAASALPAQILRAAALVVAPADAGTPAGARSVLEVAGCVGWSRDARAWRRVA